MATSSRQSALFGIQDWKRIYQTYREADFQSYDYETLRKSFIDYLTINYPETFNDYVESSEFVALLDVMAFMGQALAFRNDLNARENFIDTAERRDSVIKLANLVGYTPKRNITSQGFLKIVAISTSENVIDINGVNLSNTTILWNDASNGNWQEQFNAILNASLVNSQRIGRPGSSKIINDIRNDVYGINILPNELAVVPFTTQVDGIDMSFELVSSEVTDRNTIQEVPPAPKGQFNIMYRNDQMGFGSVNTGFFAYFKEGTLQTFDFTLPERIENNVQNIDIQGINNTDTWMYELNDSNTPTEQWIQVDSVYNNITSQVQVGSRKKFSVTSRANDQVRYNFGDGVFSDIPVGKYRAYIRSGNALSYIIDPTEMQGITVAINYINRYNKLETLTVTLSLQVTVSTAQQRESLSQIKQRAPLRYYTQNRMVNGEDYSNFPYTLFNSIIKSKALNRSSIGVSRNQDLADPTGKYSSTNIFGDDGVLWTEDENYTTTFSTLNINIAVEFLSITLSSLLASPGPIQYYQKYYPRYSGYYSSGPINNNVYWQTASQNEGEITGYFYVLSQIVPTVIKTPVPLGNFSGETLRLVSAGTNLKFVPPAGYYFDINRQLQAGIPNPSLGDSEELWSSVSEIIGDGYNFGRGTLSNGLGPVRLTEYIPTGALLDPSFSGATDPLPGEAIIPSLDNTLREELLRDALDNIRIEQSFSLVYNNEIVNPENRWSLEAVTNPNWFVKFEFNAVDKIYLVSVRSTQYYFGSVRQVRFLFEKYKRIYDPKSGQTLSDYINVLKTNSTSSLTGILGVDYIISIIGQNILSDGFANDYSVEVSTINLTTGSIANPEFFTDIVGTTGLVFFRILDDIESLYKTEIVPAGEIITAYDTEAQILAAVYEYKDNTVFFANTEEKFFRSNRIFTVDEIIYELDDVTSEYLFKPGRYLINFQYRHNTSNTSRVDPGTTNIIDLYLVTQGYYTQYQKWINDTTGVIAEPSKPTMTELQELYGDLNNYKMLSDTIVLNSVVFKPLFGQKAAPALRGKIKVIKSTLSAVSDSQVRTSVLSALNSYFTLDKWDFGDTFYMSELTAYLHAQLAGVINSVVLVPDDPNQTFGDLYEISCAPNEIFVNGATTNDIIIISALTPQALQR